MTPESIATERKVEEVVATGGSSVKLIFDVASAQRLELAVRQTRMRGRRLCDIDIPQSDFSQSVKEQWLLLVAAGGLTNKQKFMSLSRSPPPSLHPVLLVAYLLQEEGGIIAISLGFPPMQIADPESFHYCTVLISLDIYVVYLKKTIPRI